MIELPEGWTHEALPFGQFAVIHAANKGMVTVDYDARTFRGGLSTMGRTDIDPTLSRPQGRGWRQRLEENAVEWLLNAIEPPILKGKK